MTPARWQKIENVLQAAIERGPADRHAFLDEACSGDESLRQEIESLLASSEQVRSFIETPAHESAAALITDQEGDSMLGQRLGAYQIISLLGAGGMGEVYLAQDTRLGRKAAIKLLPAFFIEDDERVRRFKQEARAASALNHPNVATIYEIGESGEATYIAMEYVEGQTLTAKISGLPLDSTQIVEIAAQVADALDEAHTRGITHRDIKSENVMLNERGRVKVLDFGLAKIRAESSDALASATLQKTGSGIVMGTVQYMSPEQALGKAVDGRTDIFSLGTVMYEMATGRLPFSGTTPADTIERITHGQPEAIARLNYETPAELERIIRKCLEKDRERRYQTARDLLIDLKNLKRDTDSAMVAGVAAAANGQNKGSQRDIGGVMRSNANTAQLPAGTKRRWAPWAAALALLIPLVALSWIHFREQAPPDPVPVRFQILAPSDKAPLDPYFAISPDGRKLAFVYQDRLWVHFLETGKSVDLTPAFGTPFWSPDSRFIGFPADGNLKKIEATGGPAQTVCAISSWGAGSWNRDDVIIFGTVPGPILKVAAAGGVPVPVTQVDSSRQERTHAEPWFLPDGRHFLYVRRGAQTGYPYYIGSLDAKPEDQGAKPLLTADGQPVYAPSPDPRTGYVLFTRERTLMAQAFDTGKGELTGQPVAVAERVRDGGGWFSFSVSTNGVLVFQRDGSALNSQLTWFDRLGKALGTVGEPAPYVQVQLSPDGKQAATVRGGANWDIWLLELARGAATRFTSDPVEESWPVWSPDGSRIIFRKRGSGLVLKASNGAGAQEQLVQSLLDTLPTSWSHDGRFLLYSVIAPETRSDIWVVPVDGDRKPAVVLNTEFNEYGASFSPDGHWIAYTSDESGKDEVYVRPFDPPSVTAAPAVGAKRVISTGAAGGSEWRNDGKELYYVSGDGKFMAVEIATSPVFRAGAPQTLFQFPTSAGAEASTADGKRSLIAMRVGENSSEPYSVVLNWTSLLKH